MPPDTASVRKERGGRSCVTGPAWTCCCGHVPPRRTQNAPGGAAAEYRWTVGHPWLVPVLSLHLQGTPAATMTGGSRRGRPVVRVRPVGDWSAYVPSVMVARARRVDQPTRRLQRLLTGCGEVTASVAARPTAGPGDTMLRLDLRPVAALVVVVVDAAVVRAVLLRRRVESGHLGHVAAPRYVPSESPAGAGQQDGGSCRAWDGIGMLFHDAPSR